MRRARPSKSSARVVSSSGSEPPASNQSTMRAVSSASSDADKDVGHGRADQLVRDGVGALELALVFELELAGDGRQRRVDVGDARRRRRLARRERAPLGVADDVFQHADRQALAHAGALVDAAVGARLKRDLLDDLPHPGRHLE